MRIFLLGLIFSSFLFSAGWDDPCILPSGKMRIPNPTVAPTDYNSTVLCSHTQGTYYYCYATSEKHEIWTINDPISPGSALCNVNTRIELYTYVDANCGDNAMVDGAGDCVCNVPLMIFDPNTLTCACPAGSIYNGDYCEDTCEPLEYPYVVWTDATTQSLCTQSNLQTVYDTYDPGKVITDVQWKSCSSTCYYTFEHLTVPGDTNNSDTNSTDTNSTNTSGSGGTVGGNTPLSGDLYGVELKLNEVNTNLGVLSSHVKTAGDINHAETKYQGDRLHEDLNNLRLSNNTNHDNLMLSQGNLETTLGYMHNQLGTVIDELRNNNAAGTSSGDINITNDFDDSGIIEANNNTTKSINELKNLDTDTLSDLTNHIDDFSTTIDDFTQLYSDLEASLDNISSSFTGDYVPQFQSHNSCIFTFVVFTKPINFNLCHYASQIRPFLVFVLTIYFLVLISRLHLYFISNLMTRYG